MAKINVTGSAVVITSTLKLNEVATIQKYRPDALTLRGGEDGKEPIFKIGIPASGTGSINKYGAAFDAETHNEGGFATITMMLGEFEGDIKEHIADTIGQPVNLLGQLEEALSETAAAIKTERQNVMNNITLS